MNDSIITTDNSNIAELRSQYPDGLHFVVGDTHGEWKTLEKLMDNILFDPAKDHVYFVGDYNDGGNVKLLLTYISRYYAADYNAPGFHLIRGNHELYELYPEYALENLPEIIVVRGKEMNYYIAHAGMVSPVFDCINQDIKTHPERNTSAYKLDEYSMRADAPFRQIIWSQRGLYSQRSYWHVWPSGDKLLENHACIIHGHTPYPYFIGRGYFSYGDNNLFWENQHIFFSEDLQGFDIDSNIKGVHWNGQTYRGLTCICLEVLDEIAKAGGGMLTTDGIRNSQNFVFYAELAHSLPIGVHGDIGKVLDASPAMSFITADNHQFALIK